MQMENKIAKEFRKFKPFDFYQTGTEKYYLLPFRFHQINSEKEVIVNVVGDFHIEPIGTARRIAEKEIEYDETTFIDLVNNFIISEKPIHDLIDVLATRYRTKKSFLDDFTALHIFVVSLRCNHSCHYCQVSRVSENRQDFDMSVENLKHAIEHMFRSPSAAVTMEFQGGQPLLAFEKIQFGVEYAKPL